MNPKDQIITEFITKTEYLVYKNDFGVCNFCGMGDDSLLYIDERIKKHHPDCLYSRAYQLVLTKTVEKSYANS